MIPATAQDVTPGWLTECLRAEGCLVTVKGFEIIRTHTTNVSRVYHLAVTYAQASPDVPAGLILKLPNTDSLWSQREPQFYREIVPMMQLGGGGIPFLVRCYSAAYDPETTQAHLLFEDLSATHSPLAPGEPSTSEYVMQIISSLALFHAYWWQRPELGTSFGQRLTPVGIAEGLRLARDKFPRLRADLAGQLSAAQGRALEKVLAGWPARRRERVLNGQGITLVHRDLHPLNFLYPRAEGHTRIIDWDAWRVDTGTDDLAYMMACWWDVTLRDHLEQALLRRYYQKLIEFGVKDYDWADCQYDYRASIIRCLLFLMVAWSPAVGERLQRGLLAFEQYHCVALLD